MAGLITKELKRRHLIKKLLIVSPGHLKDQWRRKLSEKFKEKFFLGQLSYQVLKHTDNRHNWKANAYLMQAWLALLETTQKFVF